MTKIKNYVNRVVLLLDASGSMASLRSDVINVFDQQIKYLAKKSQEMDQETRVTVYQFNGNTECLVWDKDVLRMPSIREFYFTGGSTNLIGATIKAIQEVKTIPEIYGDCANLVYVLTDGANTDENNRSTELSRLLSNLPENWTVAALVPSAMGAREAASFVFPKENIQVWSTTSEGVKEVSSLVERTTGAYMRARASGIRGTKSLFTLDSSNLTKSVVKTQLQELNPSEYQILQVRKDSVIKPFIESWGIGFRQGMAFYELTKKEKVQADKQIAIKNKLNGRVYSGLQGRKVLGLPDYEVSISPENHSEYVIFIQSNSNNRKLIAGTQLLILN